MATIGEVLRHLVRHAPNLSDDNRAEMLEAVSRATGEPEPGLGQAPATPGEAPDGDAPPSSPSG